MSRERPAHAESRGAALLPNRPACILGRVGPRDGRPVSSTGGLCIRSPMPRGCGRRRGADGPRPGAGRRHPCSTTELGGGPRAPGAAWLKVKQASLLFLLKRNRLSPSAGSGAPRPPRQSWGRRGFIRNSPTARIPSSAAWASAPEVLGKVQGCCLDGRPWCSGAPAGPQRGERAPGCLCLSSPRWASPLAAGPAWNSGPASWAGPGPLRETEGCRASGGEPALALAVGALCPPSPFLTHGWDDTLLESPGSRGQGSHWGCSPDLSSRSQGSHWGCSPDLSSRGQGSHWGCSQT